MKKTTFYLLFGFAFLFAMATAEDCKPDEDDDCTCAIDCPEDTCDPTVDTVPCVAGTDDIAGCTCDKTCPAATCTGSETCTDSTAAYCTCTLGDGNTCTTDADVCACVNTCAHICDDSVACDDGDISTGDCECTKTCPTEKCTDDSVPDCTCNPIAPAVGSCKTDTTGAGGAGDCACAKPSDASCDEADPCAKVNDVGCTCDKKCPTDSCTGKEPCADSTADYCTCTLGDGVTTCTTDADVCNCENTCANVCDEADACTAIDEAGCTCTKPCTESTCTNDGDTCTDPTTDANCKCTKGAASVTSSTIINIMLPLMVTSYKLFNYVIA